MYRRRGRAAQIYAADNGSSWRRSARVRSTAVSTLFLLFKLCSFPKRCADARPTPEITNVTICVHKKIIVAIRYCLEHFLYLHLITYTWVTYCSTYNYNNIRTFIGCTTRGCGRELSNSIPADKPIEQLAPRRRIAHNIHDRSPLPSAINILTRGVILVWGKTATGSRNKGLALMIVGIGPAERIGRGPGQGSPLQVCF